jgi:hypothetical protein
VERLKEVTLALADVDREIGITESPITTGIKLCMQ